MCGVTHTNLARSKPIAVPKPILDSPRSVAMPSPESPQKMALPSFVVARPAAPAMKEKKHIQFSPLVQVVLIPCLAEYREANVLPSMFWSSEDIKLFRMELLYAFKEYLMRTPCDGIDKKSALKRMLADESYEV